MKQQNARCVSTKDGLFLGKCHVCGALFQAPWRDVEDVRAWYRLWIAFVWEHEGCDLEPLSDADTAWLREALR